jgi:hypothetical protein
MVVAPDAAAVVVGLEAEHHIRVRRRIPNEKTIRSCSTRLLIRRRDCDNSLTQSQNVGEFSGVLE